MHLEVCTQIHTFDDYYSVVETMEPVLRLKKMNYYSYPNQPHSCCPLLWAPQA